MNRPIGRFGVLLLLLPPVAAGCSSAAGGGDPASAREVLVDVLEAWKGGQKSDEAARRTGIVNGDPRWQEGYQLTAYRIGAEAVRAGHDHNFPVALDLRDAQGKAIRETAYFTVAVRPVKTVIRAAFETPDPRGF